MAREADPLCDVERVAFAEEVSSVVRHAVKNKIAAARNAATYVRRKLSATEAWTKDARIQTFSSLIDSELDAANGLLEPRSALGAFGASKGERVQVAACVELATSTARIAQANARVVQVHVEAGEVAADPRELALAIRCLVENAVEAVAEGTGKVVVDGRPADATYALKVSDDGPGVEESRREEVCQPMVTTKTGHAGVGLAIARRIARRWGGALTLGRANEGGLEATITLPLGKAG